MGDGFTTTLFLRNKDPRNSVRTRVVLLRNDGSEEREIPIELAAHSASRLALSNFVETPGYSSKWGGLFVESVDGPAGKVIGNAIIENYRNGIIFDVGLLGGYRYDTENTLHAAWWLPDNDTDGTLTLFNLSDQSIVVSPSIATGDFEFACEQVALRPRETKRVSLLGLMRKHNLRDVDRGSITLRYTGMSHALSPALLLANPETGFSLVSAFNAQHDRPATGQTKWHFADVFFSPDTDLGFKRTERLTAYVLLSNCTEETLAPQLKAHVVGQQGAVREVSLPTSPLLPRQTRLVNLSSFVGLGTLPGNMSHCALDVGHPGSPGDLGVTVFSLGETKDFVINSEGSVRPSTVMDSTYWDISGERVALLAVQNPSSGDVRVKTTLWYQTQAGVHSYGLPAIDLPANGSRILNLRSLVLSGIPDETGSFIPEGTVFGTLTIASEGGDSSARISGGATSFDPERGGYGIGIFPNCDFCLPGLCEECLYATPEGGVCVPSCADPFCCPPPETCAVPVNFRQTSVSSQASGTLHFEYAWNSSTGSLRDLSACTVGETVTYSPGDIPFPPPFPPLSPPNPTVGAASGTLGAGVDNHSTPGTFVKPYSARSFTATQIYWYSCPCSNGGQRVTILGPLAIVRSVSLSKNASWKFTITKSGSSATINPLP